MKAIICPQCGGLIKKVSEGKSIADCGYCGAKVLLPRAEKPAPEPETRDTSRVPLEDYKPFDDYDPYHQVDHGDLPIEEFLATQNETAFKIIAVVGAVGVVVFMFIALGLGGVIKRGGTSDDDIPPTPYRYTPTPAPQYVVTTLGNADAESLPVPVLPKGVTIKAPVQIPVVVSVDEQGAVYDAQSYEGPEALRKAAIQAARKARFPVKNGQRSSGILTYDFTPKR